jgi:GDPmannose 4,6-dehydratase
MWLMLQVDEPEDFVIATGETHTVRELVELAFEHVGLDPAEHVEIDERHMRPAEVHRLVGDASKARSKLGWEPKTRFEDLIRMMVDADVELLTPTAERLKAAGAR